MRSRKKGMVIPSIERYFWVTCALASHLLINSVVSAQSWCPLPPNRSLNTEFKQKINRFWEFEEKTNRWVEISLPYDLMSCTNGSCNKVGSIKNWGKKSSQTPEAKNQEKNNIIDCDHKEMEERLDQVLPIRKRLSITRMSEASIWVTGQSGSIYERLWNGIRWVIAPHELPTSAGPAVSVFIVNQTILALSEAGMLYQVTSFLQLGPPLLKISRLYEFDKKTKPSWKKHIWSEASLEAVPLAASLGCTLHGLVGAHSLSLFLRWKPKYILR